MALTRAQVEEIIVNRLNPLMSKAGMEVTYAGSNADLNDSIWWALVELDLSVANILSVTDSDINGVAESDYAQFLDMVELRTLENIVGNLTLTDIRAGIRDEKLHQLTQQVERKIARLMSRLQRNYGYGLSTPEANNITLDFAGRG